MTCKRQEGIVSSKEYFVSGFFFNFPLKHQRIGTSWGDAY